MSEMQREIRRVKVHMWLAYCVFLPGVLLLALYVLPRLGIPLFY